MVKQESTQLWFDLAPLFQKLASVLSFRFISKNIVIIWNTYKKILAFVSVFCEIEEKISSYWAFDGN